jgi:pyrroloquinoline quinone biosynthesis protein B
MQAIVLGSAAGGGIPQWNCRCPVCRLAWEGDPRVRARTQSSLAISANGADWLLVNASPDIRLQIAQTIDLQPRQEPRHSPIAAVLLTNGDVDHTAGLLTLRESQPFTLYGSAAVLSALAQNPIFGVLGSTCVARHEVRFERSFEPIEGLHVTIFAIPGKVPLWLETGQEIIGETTGVTIGAMFECGSQRLAYIPGCASVTDELRNRLAGVDVLLFDGTVLHDDDLARAGVGVKTGRRMGHVPMAGENGSIDALADIPIGKRIFVHINNTNPVLIEDSDERQLVEKAGWTIAEDGLRIVL